MFWFETAYHSSHQHVRHPSYFIIFYSLNLTCLQEVIRRICIDGISDSIFYGPYGDSVALSFFKVSVLLTLSTHVSTSSLIIYMYFFTGLLSIKGTVYVSDSRSCVFVVPINVNSYQLNS